ncbi:1-phosphofructokinase family hexose kinase [Actinosynnema sp.]|uniref:1-phosphofructokinase family hexose kinase n=1 Tax=Actinosynnema sp. TaxID=1872144 RepID=UPI003F8579DC
MIVTVTPNPSLDRTAAIGALTRGEVLRASSVRLEPGGKGVNVARALTAAGADAVALLPVGGASGRLLLDLLGEVPAVPVPVAGHTRANTALVEADGTTTKINEPGPELSPAEVDALVGQSARLCADADWLVCCGSLPPGAPADLYARLAAGSGRARVAVDSSGAPLAHAGPVDLLAPNHAELAELAGAELPTLGAVLGVSRALLAAGVGAVLVTLGAHGALLVDPRGAHHAIAPPTTVRSTVGAGDAALAGFLRAGGGGPDALRAAVAYGTAAVAAEGSRMPGPTEVHPDAVRLVDVDENLTLSGGAP